MTVHLSRMTSRFASWPPAAWSAGEGRKQLPAPLSHFLPHLEPPWIPLKRAGTQQNFSWCLSLAFDSMESEKQKCEQFPETRVLEMGSAVLTSETRTWDVQAWGSQQRPNAWPCLQPSSHFFLGIHPEVKMLIHMIIVCLSYCSITISFSIVAAHFFIPTSNAQRF